MDKEIIISTFRELGFVLIGFLNSREAKFDDFVPSWINGNHHAGMKWMENHPSIRANPCSIEPNTNTLISLAYPYKTETPEQWKEECPISSYAWGEDYHLVLRKKLRQAEKILKEKIAGFSCRSFIDTAPLPEKAIAARCGLGWVGKNGMLINRKYGSYLFLAEVACDLEIESTLPAKDRCGSCVKCLEACPTSAILPNRTIDSNRCVSYLTIEKRGPFTESEAKSIGYHLFGCDICQEVCPWNRRQGHQSDSSFACSEKWLSLSPEAVLDLSPSEFDKLKIKSPLKRAKLEGLQRNARAVLKNRKRKQMVIDAK